MLIIFRRCVGVPGGFFIAFRKFPPRLFAGAALTFSHVTQTSQNAEEDVEREKNGRLMKHPFSEALKKCSAHSEENAHADAAHGVGCSRPKKTRAHEQPAEPEQ